MDATDAPPPAPTPAPAARRRRTPRVLAALALALLLVLLLPLAGLLATWRWSPALPWVLGQVPGLRVEGVRGPPASGRVEIDLLDWQLPGGAGRLQLRTLVIEGLAWRWGEPPQLRIDRLSAQAAVFQRGPPSGTPLQLPRQLRSPVALSIDALEVVELRIDTLPPLRALKARLAVGDDAGAMHRLTVHGVDWEQAHLGGDARLGSAGTLPLTLEVQARALGARPWQASLQARGPLQRLAVQARASGEARDGHPAPALQAEATLLPFAAWPLASLALSTRELDLAALSTRLPQTALSGNARLRSTGLDQPADADITLDNRLPGRWNEGRLPVRQLLLSLAGEPRRTDRLALQRLQLQLGDAQGNAGSLRGNGQWQGDALALTLELDAVQPARLDARAAPLRVAGPLSLRATGLPRPGASGPATPTVTVEARLTGQALDGSGKPVSLNLAATGDASRIQLARAEARAGDARVEGSGEARREPDGWHLALDAALARFDPLPWWRGAEGSAWRQGPHRVDGRLQARVVWHGLPPAATARPAAADPGEALSALRQRWQRALSGTMQATLDDSVLAGVPLSGELTVANGAALEAALRLQLAANRLQARLRRGAAADRVELTVDAPRLDSLAPLGRLVQEIAPATGAWLPVAGSLQADARLDGRWPVMRSDGTLSARGLRSRAATLAGADARWRHGDSAAEPLALQLQAQGLASGALQIDRLDLQLAGSLASHTLKLVADSPAKPPAWTENLLGPAGSGTRLQAEGRAEWQRQADGSRWRLLALTLRGGARDAPTGSAPWLAASGLTGSLDLDADARPRALSLAPGRVQLLTTALRWQQVDWLAAASGPGRLTVAAELESIDVAAWLRRLQPEMGWSGDLNIVGRIDIQAAERFDADVVLERAGGDLAITDDLGNRQALGVSELRLALGAHDGLWQFAQGVAGQHVGEMAGAQVIRTDPARRWPEDGAPMQGVLQARVAKLGVWGTWVPPGWRLAGTLETTAILGGRVGAPELRGRMRGSGLGVRNLLQGVNLADGELAIALDGDRATIERFDFRGGDGRLTLDGGLTLGAEPSLKLTLAADKFRVLGRVDRRVVASGSAELRARRGAAQVNGAFVVDEGLIDLGRADAPTLDSDVVVHRPNPAGMASGASGAGTGVAATGSAAPGATAGSPGTGAAAVRPTATQVDLDLRLDLGRALRLRGRGVDTGLQGQLRLSSPGNRLTVHGSVRTVGGTYLAYGQALELARGELAFNGPLENPRLDVLALRPDLDVLVGVAITGFAQSPRIRLTSEPEMADIDKLSWLVLGRGPDGLGRADTALLQRAAVALLAGDGRAPTDALLESLGITDFSLRQTEGEVRETIVSLGRQLSRRWWVGYERSVNATTGTWQLIYRVARRFTLRAQSGGDNSVDMIWSWRW